MRRIRKVPARGAVTRFVMHRRHCGWSQIAGVPFAPGTEVEVTISPKRKSAAEFIEAWQRVTAELRSLPGADALTDDAIKKEINDFRAGR